MTEVYMLEFEEFDYERNEWDHICKGIFSSAEKAARAAEEKLPGLIWYTKDDKTPDYDAETRIPNFSSGESLKSIEDVVVGEVNIWAHELDEWWEGVIVNTLRTQRKVQETTQRDRSYD